MEKKLYKNRGKLNIGQANMKKSKLIEIKCQMQHSEIAEVARGQFTVSKASRGRPRSNNILC